MLWRDKDSSKGTFEAGNAATESKAWNGADNEISLHLSENRMRCSIILS